LENVRREYREFQKQNRGGESVEDLPKRSGVKEGARTRFTMKGESGIPSERGSSDIYIGEDGLSLKRKKRAAGYVGP